MQDIANPEERQRNLDRMKRQATGLLVLMGGIFILARILEPQHPWLGYIRATAEASMVGGIADWFAITALFRHPLNIPIPHTAIIPSRTRSSEMKSGRGIAATRKVPASGTSTPTIAAIQPSAARR